MKIIGLSLGLLGLMFFQARADGQDVTGYSGPYGAEVVRVIDGDTIEVRVDVWPGLVAEYSVRVRGIDAPDLAAGDCENGLRFEEEVNSWVTKTYPPAKIVRLENVERGSFAGRVVADVKRWRSDRWLSLADELIERGYAVAWEPGMDAPKWCLLAPK